MTKVGDIIESGPPIPADVIGLDNWYLTPAGHHWHPSPAPTCPYGCDGDQSLALRTQGRALTVTAVREPDPDRGCDECSSEPGEGHVAPCSKFVRPAPQPLVLSLPQVPEGAVALIGGRTQRRYMRSDFPDSWKREENGWLLSLGELFVDEGGSATVVMREPRTPLEEVQALRDELTRLHDGGYSGAAGEAFAIADRIERALTEAIAAAGAR